MYGGEQTNQILGSYFCAPVPVRPDYLKKDNAMTENTRAWSVPQILWSGVFAIVIWSAIGFSWLGFGFGWKTPDAAEQIASQTLLDSLTAICVAQAKNAPDSAIALKEFAAINTWKQPAFVEEAQWATMPGGDSASSGVADECATQLRKTG